MNDELYTIFGALTGYPQGTIALLKNRIRKNWCLSAGVTAPTNTITVTSATNLVTTTRDYWIGKPDGNAADKEVFRINSISGNTLTLNVTLTKPHPLTADPMTSHTVVEEDPGGLAGASNGPSVPVLIAGATTAQVGFITAHEQMHTEMLSDVNLFSNVMHYVLLGGLPLPSNKLGFRFKDQVQVNTGTSVPTPGAPPQNQWEDAR